MLLATHGIQVWVWVWVLSHLQRSSWLQQPGLSQCGVTMVTLTNLPGTVWKHIWFEINRFHLSCSGEIVCWPYLWFLMSTTFSQICICGRVFTNIGAFSQHKKGCKRGKKHLSSALERAKEIYQHKRIQMHCGGDQPDNSEMGSTQEDNHLHATLEGGLVCGLCRFAYLRLTCFKDNQCLLVQPAPELQTEPDDHDTQSLAQCRTHWSNRQLPLHFRNLLSEPPMPLPPAQELPEAHSSEPSPQTCLV